MSGEGEGAPRLSWARATYRFPPLRNALIAGVLLALGLLIEVLGAPEEAALTAFLLAVVVGARDFALEGLEKLVDDRVLGIEILMALAAAGAMVFGLFEEAAALVFLYATAEAVEELTFARTRTAIRDLLDLAPKQARLLLDGRERMVAAEDLRPGDVFVVRPGESLATDGRIREGRSSLNESQITGEAAPVDKGPGEEVFAGSVNGEGAIEVETTRAFEDNTLQRIVHLVEDAQAQKSRAQRFIDRFSVRYSPAVIAAAALIAVVPVLLGGDVREWALRGVTLLVAAAPCALVMSVPVAAAAAISRAGRSGILVKGGLQLEALARVDTVCFDKTGTLTAGAPRVTDVLALDGDQRAALALAASVEARSEHPLAQAIVSHAREEGVDLTPAEDFRALVGHGATGRVNGNEAWVGSPAMIDERAPASRKPAALERLQEEGKTVVCCGEGDHLVALIALRDEPRPEAQKAIASLRGLGIRRVVMLTGDNTRTAQAIARELEVDEVRAELKPEDKVRELELLRKQSSAIAMVGDGINDAPALAVADLGIAMGTGGTDAAIEAADIALMSDDLAKLPEALRLGRRAARISRQNLFFSVVLLAVLIPSAVIGLLTVVAAVLVHEVSELLAVGNGVRAARGESPRAPRAVAGPTRA